jgi:hypothetical protein
MLENAAFLTAPEPEWDRAWWEIAAAYGDPDCYNPRSGEAWQYHGTYRNEAGQWQHSFRHRDLPVTGRRTYHLVDAAPEWRPRSPYAPGPGPLEVAP